MVLEFHSCPGYRLGE
ncbi:hypothetical protein MTR67_027753 [Solanum verrucosum]|uniref:Uncharacterized protein n=1 Tax=Solanum verrucosum TaxID=315347 RepID=A0AAF0R596_SOLVR|nr:hypothetical protein MTR67_027753 [Solanum verrucosum]